MPESLNVIALVSGGKDSFFSILHCIQNGHKIIALGNLHPPLTGSPTKGSSSTDHDENDLNSFMYQTVGHTIIPLYEEALGIPLYRQAIVGGAVQKGTSYSHADITSSQDGKSAEEERGSNKDADETESLVPLLKRIMHAHPVANALSTGAILSTYQRTRVESVALRLGLIPLSFLWQYPNLPPCMQISLLQDMNAVGLDARIIKVASGGLDESFLWENVTSVKGMQRVEKAMKRFSIDGDGAVLGEGGEFETLVVDGPSWLFKKSIVVDTKDPRIIREGGGSAWIQICNASLADKEVSEDERSCRTPDLFDQRSLEILRELNKNENSHDASASSMTDDKSIMPKWELTSPNSRSVKENNLLHWTIAPEIAYRSSTSEEAASVVEIIKSRLNQNSLSSTDIVSTTIILRSMEDFTTTNKIYSTLFPHPNPPSRVTIACGSSMPLNMSLVVHLTLHIPSPALPARKALHVQSRSYWAPANIGPYSQASSLPSSQSLTIAGQIPLIPHTMLLPTTSSYPALPSPTFHISTVLSLQHLLRIADATSTKWFTSACIYIPSHQTTDQYSPSTRSKIAYQAWKQIHTPQTQDFDDDDDDEPRDLWEEKFRYSSTNSLSSEQNTSTAYPDHDLVQSEVPAILPFWTAEVDSLPRGSEVEWHAHLGICDGPINVLDTSTQKQRTNSLMTPTTRHTILTFPHNTTPSPDDFEDNHVDRGLLHLVYVDTSILDMNKLLSEGWEGHGLIPCKSLWDGEGKRLSSVIVFWGGDKLEEVDSVDRVNAQD